jgi:hypothetical protein
MMNQPQMMMNQPQMMMNQPQMMAHHPLAAPPMMYPQALMPN